jgi:chromosome segregation protein
MRSAGELRERETQLGRRAERLAVELAHAQAEAERLVGERGTLAAARDRAAAELVALEVQRQRLEAQEATAERRLTEAEAQLADARVELAVRRSSFEAISELERAREGYGAGVRAVFADGRRDELHGIVGTVADLLEVPSGMERAIEAVLGERLQWVVVQRFEHARAAVAYLRDHALGSATFLPLEHLPAPSDPGPAENGVRWVAHHVSATAASLVHHLLGQVAVVEHLDEAEQLWRRNGVVATYVTPGGEVLGPTGRLHGGGTRAASDTEHSLLARKRQLRELEMEVERLAIVVETGQSEITTLGAEFATLREQIGELARAVQARLAERLAGDKDVERAGQEHTRVQRHVETVEAGVSSGRCEADETSDLARLGQRIAVARDAESALEAAVARVRDAIESAQSDETALGAELTSCRVDLASVTERVEALGRELSRVEEIERDPDRALAQAGSAGRSWSNARRAGLPRSVSGPTWRHARSP